MRLEVNEQELSMLAAAMDGLAGVNQRNPGVLGLKKKVYDALTIEVRKNRLEEKEIHSMSKNELVRLFNSLDPAAVKKAGGIKRVKKKLSQKDIKLLIMDIYKRNEKK
jgi:hypothetical protein